MKNKVFRGVIKNWQLHHETIPQDLIDEVYPGVGATPVVFTGTVVEDPTGRRSPNDHTRSSLIVSIDEDKGIIETINSTYKIIGKEGGDIFGDLGDKVLNIFY